jgi:hypothetical protein
MIPVSFSFIAHAGQWRSAAYPSLEGVRAVAQRELQRGYSGIDILLLIGGSEYLVEQVLSDPCHKITYYAITKSCEGVGEDSYEGTFVGAMAWVNRVIQMSRVVHVELYLKVAGRKHLIDFIEAK